MISCPLLAAAINDICGERLCVVDCLCLFQVAPTSPLTDLTVKPNFTLQLQQVCKRGAALSSRSLSALRSGRPGSPVSPPRPACIVNLTKPIRRAAERSRCRGAERPGGGFCRSHLASVSGFNVFYCRLRALLSISVYSVSSGSLLRPV